MAYSSGLVTGLLGYSIKKEMMGDAIFYRELQTFRYEMFSMDIKGQSATAIHNNILNEFKTKYSGDINVKVFEVPADYSFPNDSVRLARFNVEVQVKTVPSISTWQPELSSSAYYNGLYSALLASGSRFLDFKEGFDFEVADDGKQVFKHDISFGLLSGTRQGAIAVATGIYGRDKDTTFGISVMAGTTLNIADNAQFVNYYSETFDTIRNQYSFSRRRELLPTGASTYLYNLIHTLDLKEDGTADVAEKGTIKGKLDFNGATAGLDTLMGGVYTRCNNFYGTYYNFANDYPTPNTLALVNTPIKITKVYNKYAISTEYEVTFTNNPQFLANGTQTVETIQISDAALGIVDIKHSFDFVCNRRVSSTNFGNMIDAAYAASPTTIATYFGAYTPQPPWTTFNLVKKDMSWLNRKNRGARLIMDYSNNPKYFQTVNGLSFRLFDVKINHEKPMDLISEYKVINRPSKLSVINYAYQTERGKITVVVEAGITRNPDEFVTGFRSDMGNIINALYQYACTAFFGEFKNVIPLAFTYYMSDVKYTYNSDSGTLQLTVQFTYSVKKYGG